MKKTITDEIELLDLLKQIFPQSSTNKLRKMLSNGRIKINSEIVQGSSNLGSFIPPTITLPVPGTELKASTKFLFT